MAESQLAFEDARGGMNAFDPPHKIATNQVARMVNCCIVDGHPTTRMGARVVPITGIQKAFVSQAAIQGSIHYNPAKGQGGIVLSAANSTLALAVGGRKYLVKIEGRHLRSTAVPKDVSGGLFGNGQYHLVWLSQWENLLVAADGRGRTWIYDPEKGASLSRGYNTVEKLKSQIPNGATVLGYVHGRGIAVVNSRQIIVGDSLHRTSLTTSSNLIEFTEQVHWATGQAFVPPSAMGGINAGAILALKNTQHGHGDYMFHCEDGIFSLDLNQNPRSSWADKPLVKHAILQAGATGPYAVAILDGDQIYRTRKGAQSLRSAAATSGMEGDPDQTLSPEVDTWLSGDYPRWLRFASVSIWDVARRVFFSTSPIVAGSYRWHRGIVVRNHDVAITRKGTEAVWEGLWTFPPEFAGIVQTVGGLFDGEERQFAWTRGNDQKNRLVEFSHTSREDILEDGTRHPIRSQVITRAIDAGKWWETREFTRVRLYLGSIAGRVRWGVWYRSSESPGWKFLLDGEVTVPDFSADPFDLSAPDKRNIAIPLGELPNICLEDATTRANQSRAIQFLVRWQGFCAFEGIKVECGSEDLSIKELEKEKLAHTFVKGKGCVYDDFEYSSTVDPLWIDNP